MRSNTLFALRLRSFIYAAIINYETLRFQRLIQLAYGNYGVSNQRELEEANP